MGTVVERFLWTVLMLLPVLALSEALRVNWQPLDYSDNKTEALKFLANYNSTGEEVLFHSRSASWNYNTNLTDENSAIQVGKLLSQQE